MTFDTVLWEHNESKNPPDDVVIRKRLGSANVVSGSISEYHEL